MPETYSWMPEGDSLIDRGMENRLKVLGADHVEKALKAADGNPFMRMLQESVTRLAWGAIWDRPGLDIKSRSLVTLSVLLARGQLEEFALHIRGALRNGWKKQELAEVIIQIGCYAGWPAAIQGFRIAAGIFDEASE